MGNIDALRDWGHAKDYVEMQWLMLQQDSPEDFVVATGLQYSVRDFISWSAKEVGIVIEFNGDGLKEIGVVTSIAKPDDVKVSIGDVIVRIDERYFRPAEVETLLGDPAKAKEKLLWVPKISAQEMCAEMVAADLREAQKQVLLLSNGFDVSHASE
tara:strand:- start:173 stop:640 length:468 start_codon:yes stop_codon:yes gene_type:complete